MGKNIFIDAEWFLNQQIYLLGYAYNLSGTYQLYDYTMNRDAFGVILNDVEYPPD